MRMLQKVHGNGMERFILVQNFLEACIQGIFKIYNHKKNQCVDFKFLFALKNLLIYLFINLTFNSVNKDVDYLVHRPYKACKIICFSLAKATVSIT